MASSLTRPMSYRPKYHSNYTPAVAYGSDSYGSRTKPRPLPAGPGPLDSQGRREYKPLRNLLRSESPTRRPQPVRAQPITATPPVSKRYTSPAARYEVSSPKHYNGGSTTLPNRGTLYGRTGVGAGGLKYATPGGGGGASLRYRSCSPSDGPSSRLSRRDRTLSYSDLNRAARLRISDSPTVDLPASRADITPTCTTPVEVTRRERRYSSTRDLSRASVDLSDNLPDIKPIARHKSPERWDTNVNVNGNSTKHGLDGGGTHPQDYSPSTSNTDENLRRPVDTGSRKGLVGLQNLGNTCFMNSILQCLSNTKPLLDFCLDTEKISSVQPNKQKGAIISAYTKLMKSIWMTRDSSVAPTEFKSQISKFAPRFVGYNQQDAQEFLIYLLEGLHKDLNRSSAKKPRVIKTDDEEDARKSATQKAKESWKRYLEYDNSKIVDTFVGQLRSSLRCGACGYISDTFDPFWDLSLPIRKDRQTNAVQLSYCFELFTQEEVLDGDEKPTCAKCKKRQRCTKSFSIQKFPKVLVIHLKRFNEGSFYRSKLSTEVNFPIRDLNLTKYAADKSCPEVLYNLYAISNHSGSTYGGHYTAYAKHPRTAEWHFFNDQRVSSTSESSLQSSEAYVLFYELANPSDHH